jgi:Fe-S oxidoreductase
LDYPKYVKLDCELMHISELLAQELDAKRLRFNNEVNKTVTYQDPCRLGRHVGLYEAPRKVLSAIPGIELIEMEHNREESICCGTSCFTNCDSYSKQVRVARLLEAKGTGAECLITACPKCQTHFRCAMTNKGKEKGPDVEIEVMDLVTLVASALEAEKE